jgi:hypothetical protein
MVMQPCHALSGNQRSSYGSSTPAANRRTAAASNHAAQLYTNHGVNKASGSSSNAARWPEVLPRVAQQIASLETGAKECFHNSYQRQNS